ncbi:hypothetical protein BH23CHL5_BH23CHL5_15640 [soil metagenome]
MKMQRYRSNHILLICLLLVGGFALSGVTAQPVGAVVGAYIELHVAECPPGYDGSTLFEDCHENRVAGTTFIAEGAGGERYEMVSDVNGVAFFNDFYTAGPLTIIEKYPSGDYLGFELYCTTTENQTALPVTNSSNGRAAGSFDLPEAVIDSGTGVVCDWYYFAPAELASTGGIELHVSACPDSNPEGTLFEKCHHLVLPGTAYSIDGPAYREGVTSGPLGAVAWQKLPAGMYTLSEIIPNGNFVDYIVYCSDTGGNEVPFAYSGNGRAAVTFELGPDQYVVCDWFNIPAEVVAPIATLPVAQEAPSFGLGLTIAEWEEIHGSGTPADRVVMYESGRYAVLFSSGIVTFIETDWIDEGGVSAIDASKEVANLLPPDASLVERYYLPPTPDGPIGLVVERYESTILANRLGSLPLLWNGSLIVVYHQSLAGPQSGSAQEPMITRVSIAAGTELTGQ